MPTCACHWDYNLTDSHSPCPPGAHSPIHETVKQAKKLNTYKFWWALQRNAGMKNILAGDTYFRKYSPEGTLGSDLSDWDAQGVSFPGGSHRQCKGSEVGKKLSCSRNPAKAQCGWNVKEGGACGERGEVMGKDARGLWTWDGSRSIVLKGCSEDGDLEATWLITGRAVYALWFICL